MPGSNSGRQAVRNASRTMATTLTRPTCLRHAENTVTGAPLGASRAESAAQPRTGRLKRGSLGNSGHGRRPARVETTEQWENPGEAGAVAATRAEQAYPVRGRQNAAAWRRIPAGEEGLLLSVPRG